LSAMSSKTIKVTAVLASVAALGSTTPQNADYRDKLNELYGFSSTVSSAECSLEEFQRLLHQVHDVLISCDSILRSIIIRLVRMLLKDSGFCASVVEEEFHWLLVMSLERDHEFVQERMQALKCMRRFIELAPATFPIAFARSLVAVANNKDDNIRRVCLETLRELVIVNAEVVVRVNGLSSLLDAVIEPNTQDMSESILLSVLFLLNDPKNRFACSEVGRVVYF
jgi:rapamycin-insensitive companion of mTOR